MKNALEAFLDQWPAVLVKDSDLRRGLESSNQARYGLVKRALKAGRMVRLRRGLYVLADRLKFQHPDPYEFATILYHPAVISVEAALSHHGWIPEAVRVVTCVTSRSSKKFDTPLGFFSFEHVPAKKFYMGVNRIETATGAIFMADPWRAVADLIYIYKKDWPTLEDLDADMRIDEYDIVASDIGLLEQLCREYPSQRVCRVLKRFLKEIKRRKKEFLG